MNQRLSMCNFSFAGLGVSLETVAEVQDSVLVVAAQG